MTDCNRELIPVFCDMDAVIGTESKTEDKKELEQLSEEFGKLHQKAKKIYKKHHKHDG